MHQGEQRGDAALGAVGDAARDQEGEEEGAGQVEEPHVGDEPGGGGDQIEDGGQIGHVLEGGVVIVAGGAPAVGVAVGGARHGGGGVVGAVGVLAAAEGGGGQLGLHHAAVVRLRAVGLAVAGRFVDVKADLDVAQHRDDHQREDEPRGDRPAARSAQRPRANTRRRPASRNRLERPTKRESHGCSSGKLSCGKLPHSQRIRRSGLCAVPPMVRQVTSVARISHSASSSARFGTVTE